MLANQLIRLGIFTDSEQHGPGKWTGNVDLTRICNFGETPQFINYGVDGTAYGFVYAGRGEECKEMIRKIVGASQFAPLSRSMAILNSAK